MTLNMQRIMEEYTEKITDYGHKDEYGYYNDWFNGVRPIIKEMTNQIYQETLEEVEREIPKSMTKENCPISKMQLEVMGIEHTKGFIEGNNLAISNIKNVIQSKKEIKL